MDAYNKNRNNQILDTNVLIHRWNFGKKTLDFNWTAREYLNKYDVELKIKAVQQESYEQLIITAKYSIGTMKNVTLVWHDLETVIRMIIAFNLCYMWDKAQYTFWYYSKRLNF